MRKVYIAVSLFLLSFALYSQEITNAEIVTNYNQESTNSNNIFFIL